MVKLYKAALLVNYKDTYDLHYTVDTSVPITGIRFMQTWLLPMAVGEFSNIYVQYEPSNTTERAYTVTSDNPAVVEAHDNIITAVAEGTANVIIRSVENPAVSYTAKITVDAESGNTGTEEPKPEGSSSKFTYDVNDDGATITGLVEGYEPSNLIIPSYVDGYPVVGIDFLAFNYCDNLRRVMIPDSVTSIGHDAFHGYDSLSSVTIGSGVTSIGNGAFLGCDSLTDVYITDVAAWLNISFESYYSNPLMGNDLDKKLYLNGKLVTDLVIPDGVTSIDEYVFYNCSSLKSVTIPDSVTSIDYCAFIGCDSLSSVTIGSGVTSISSFAFNGCDSLTDVYITDVAAWLNISFEGYYSNPLTVNDLDKKLYLKGKLVTNLVIPDGVTSIGGDVFKHCASLKSVTIPDSVTSIGEYEFYCSSLITVHYGGTDEQRANISIGDYNSNLTSAAWHYECDGIICKSAEPEEPGPKPTEPKPTEPKPTEPVTTEPQPAEPDPTTPPASENAFVDVVQDAYYFEPVQWAVANGITNGLSPDSFGPDATCTRAQIVTFLWRANGSPAPTSDNNPFTDVPAGQWYTDAVLWAVEKGITSDTSATTFSPDAGCTRGQVATFLWRAEGEPASGGENIFSDLGVGAYYYDAVLWAVENSITNGMGDGTFAPDATCTRGQIVTFLYRTIA